MEIGHVIDRFIIHLFSATGVYLVAYFVTQWAGRKWPDWYDRVLPAVVIIGFLGWNELSNVQGGQPYFKAFTDLASWVLGFALGLWGLVRFKSMDTS